MNKVFVGGIIKSCILHLSYSYLDKYAILNNLEMLDLEWVENKDWSEDIDDDIDNSVDNNNNNSHSNQPSVVPCTNWM